MTLKPLVAAISFSSSLVLSGCFSGSGHHSSDGSSTNPVPANALAAERGFAADSSDRWAFYVDGDTLYAVDGKNLDAAPVTIDKITKSVRSDEYNYYYYPPFLSDTTQVTYQTTGSGKPSRAYKDVIYVKDGKLFKVSSNSTNAPVPKRLSNISNLPGLCVQLETYRATSPENAALMITMTSDQSSCYPRYYSGTDSAESDSELFIPLSSTETDAPIVGNANYKVWYDAHVAQPADSNPNCPFLPGLNEDGNVVSVNRLNNITTILLKNTKLNQYVPNQSGCQYLLSVNDNGEDAVYWFNAANNVLGNKLVTGSWAFPRNQANSDDFYIVSAPNKPSATAPVVAAPATPAATTPTAPIEYTDIVKIDGKTGTLLTTIKTDIDKSKLDPNSSINEINVMEDGTKGLYFSYGYQPKHVYFKNLNSTDTATNLTGDGVISAFNTDGFIVGNRMDKGLTNTYSPNNFYYWAYYQQITQLKGEDQLAFIRSVLPSSFVIDKVNGNHLTSTPASPNWSDCVGTTGGNCQYLLGYTLTLHTIEFDGSGAPIPFTGAAATDFVTFDGITGEQKTIASFQSSALNFYPATNVYSVLGNTPLSDTRQRADTSSPYSGTEKHELFAFPVGAPEKIVRFAVQNNDAHWVAFSAGYPFY